MADIILYRRHVPGCKKIALGRTHTRCNCPIWCDGRVDGRRVNHSLGTRDWDRAERKVLTKFDPGAPALRRKPIDEAVAAFIADCSARHLRASTVISYKNCLDALATFGDGVGVKHGDQITLDFLSRFRQSRKGRDGESAMRPASHRKELEVLRGFCKFCLARGWMPVDASAEMKAPIESDPPTLPFEQHEVDAIFSACDRITNANRASADRARPRIKAAILVMLYSGLRVSDVATLERGRVNLKTGKMLVRIMKTGAPLYLRLHADAVGALSALPIESKRYFFWTGNGKPTSVIGSLRRSVDCVLKLAGVKGHPHRFRDTFAVRLLEADTPIRTVQLLLGHSSVQTTERHYAPFVHSQQKLLDAATDKLDFSSRATGEELTQDGLGDAKGNVLPFTA